ncbi:hypothetical protein ACP70R_050204 [Stipagrostis hirtigluma subsp. patula]
MADFRRRWPTSSAWYFPKQPTSQGTGVGALCSLIPRLARSLGQATLLFHLVLEAGFCDCLTRRRRPPGSTPITSPADEYPWPAQPSQRLHVIRAGEGDNHLPVVIGEIQSTSRDGILSALLRRGVHAEPLLARLVACVVAGMYRRPTPVPRSTGDAGDDVVASTPELERSVIFAIRPCGSNSASSWRTRLFFDLSRALRWPNTFRLACSPLGQPIGPATEQISWVANVVRPMKQREPDTCALVACTVAVEAKHRFAYGFPWTAAEPEHLLRVCERNGIWRRGKGAPIEKVLNKIRHLSGVPIITNNPASNSDPALCPRLPLSSWDVHKLDDGSSDADCVAELLHGGPCVGRLWACPWYRHFDASRDGGAWVYRGCGRSQDDRRESLRLYGEMVGFHAVVCFGYRRCGDQMHVLVLDNHAPTGPWRWVDIDELDELYTLNVGCLDPEALRLLQQCKQDLASSGPRGACHLAR